jgi:pyruvate-formate lyase
MNNTFSSVEREKLIEWFADDQTVSEVRELFNATFGRYLSNKDLIQFKQENSEAIEEKRREEYEVAKQCLSPNGLLRTLRKLIREAQRIDDGRVRRLQDIATLLRLAKEVWELLDRIEREKQTEEEKIRQFVEEIMQETEKNRELLEMAQRSGLLRFHHIEVGS